MKKIPTLFERDWEGDRSRVLPIVTEGCGWVLEGEGIATRKFDGTALRFDGTNWWSRRQVGPGEQAPGSFIPVDEDADGKLYGWSPVEDGTWYYKWFLEALTGDLDWQVMPEWDPGTYELVGPKIQGNPEGYTTHQLVSHSGAEVLLVPERSFEGIRDFLAERDIEGIVFKHLDGRQAKIKKRDFGLRRA